MNIESASSASSDRPTVASVHGRSTDEAERDQDDRAADQQCLPQASSGSRLLETLSEKSPPPHSRCSQPPRQLCPEFVAEAVQRLHADDQADAGHAGRNAEQFSSLPAVAG